MDLGFTDKEIIQLLSEKKNAIGSSDAQHLFDFTKYGCTRRLAYVKTGAQPDRPFNGNEATERGSEMEKVVARHYQRVTGNTLVEVPVKVDPEFPFLICHIDRIIKNPILGDGIAEIKTATKDVWHRIKWDGVPEHYMIQVQWQMMVTGLTWGELVVFWPDGWKMLRFAIERDDKMCADLREAAIKFWSAHVAGSTLPPKLPAVDRRCANCPFKMQCQGEELLKLMENEEEAELPQAPELADPLAKFIESDDILTEAKELHAANKEKLIELIGDRTAMKVGSTPVYFRPQQSETLQREPLLKHLRKVSTHAKDIAATDFVAVETFLQEAADLADLVQRQFTNKSISRPLRVARKSGESWQK